MINESIIIIKLCYLLLIAYIDFFFNYGEDMFKHLRFNEKHGRIINFFPSHAVL